MYFSAWVAHASLVSLVAATSQYNLVKEYSGESFFDDWTFYGNSESPPQRTCRAISRPDARGPCSR